jgi:ribosomal-protein-alanine N-acetyltransferase
MMITSIRLEIKPWTEDQALDFFNLTLDEGFNLFPINIYRQASEESARQWIRQCIGKWGVWEKQSGDLLGMGGLTPWKLGDENLVDITYRLRRSAWGKGYGLELAQALVRYGFDQQKLSEITATITPDNLASKKIAEKLGMKFDQQIILLGVPTELYRLKSEDIGQEEIQS